MIFDICDVEPGVIDTAVLDKSTGFTLLEVLIAITLTGLVMGSLFALQGQNKKLTIRSLEALDRITSQRAQINAAWIDLPPEQDKKYLFDNIQTLEVPEILEDQTLNIVNFKFKLESVDIIDSSHQVLFSTTRLVDKE